MDTENWYYVTPYKKKAGPITRDRLFALYLKDKVLPSTLVWSPGMEKWGQTQPSSATPEPDRVLRWADDISI